MTCARIIAAEDDRDAAADDELKARDEKEVVAQRLQDARRALARAQADLEVLMEELRQKDEVRKCCYALRG